MFCINCGNKLTKNAKFCDRCGRGVVDEKPANEDSAVSDESEHKTVHQKPAGTSSSFRKNYLLWLISILIFFGSFVLSENRYISDNLTYLIVGASSLVGFFSFLLLLRVIIGHSPSKNRPKYIVLTVATLFLFVILAKIDPPIFNNRYTQNENGFRSAIEKQYSLVNTSTDYANREIYKNFLSKSLLNGQSEDEYVSKSRSSMSSQGILATKVALNDVYFDGTDSFADRTYYECFDRGCSNIKSQSRVFKRYVYENSSWRMTDDPIPCPRKQMYDMEPEFLSALSLISQRIPSNGDFQFVKNCLYVSYATPNTAMNGAEGQFRFVPGQSLIKLDIFVSPRYKGQDDVLTAFILAHEGQHAANYGVGLLQGKPVGCFEDEGLAFTAQYAFLKTLNQQESSAFKSEFFNSPSRELWGVYYTYVAIQEKPGVDFLTKATNFVKLDQFYQKQCSGR